MIELKQVVTIHTGNKMLMQYYLTH